MVQRPWVIAFLAAVFAGLLGLSGGPDYRRRPLRVVCVGDDWVASEVPFYLWRLLQAGTPAVEVLNEGRFRHDAHDVLQFLKDDYDRLLNFRPDVVLILVGVQDALRGDVARPRFCEDVRRIVRLTRTWQNPEGAPTLVVLTPLPYRVLPGGVPAPVEFARRVRAEINPCIQDVADREGIPLAYWDPGQEPDAENAPEVWVRWIALAWARALMPYTGIRSLPSPG